jgi:hypothetical protein
MAANNNTGSAADASSTRQAPAVPSFDELAARFQGLMKSTASMVQKQEQQQQQQQQQQQPASHPLQSQSASLGAQSDGSTKLEQVPSFTLGATESE